MPFGDGTGPMGAGPSTGRGAGNCGRAQGGWGRRNMFRATGLTGWQRAGLRPAGSVPPEYEALKAHAAALERSLEEMRRGIEQLEAKSKAE